MVGKEVFYQHQVDVGVPADPGRNGERQGSDVQANALISPLAANLIHLMEQERQRVLARSEYSEFYPQWWMYDKISNIASDYSPRWRRQVLGEKEALRHELSNEELDERQQFFRGIQIAYGIAAYPQFTPRQKDAFREELREDIRDFNIGNVTLSEPQRQVLSIIATATETPIDPDQETYHYYTVLQQPDISEKEMEEDPRYDTW